MACVQSWLCHDGRWCQCLAISSGPISGYSSMTSSCRHLCSWVFSSSWRTLFLCVLQAWELKLQEWCLASDYGTMWLSVYTPSPLTLGLGWLWDTCLPEVPSGTEPQLTMAVTFSTTHSLLAAFPPCLTSLLRYLCFWNHPINKLLALEPMSQDLLSGSPNQVSHLLTFNFIQSKMGSSSNSVMEFLCGLNIQI